MVTVNLPEVLASLEGQDPSALRLVWRNHLGGTFPKHLPRWLLIRVLAYRLQVQVHGGLDETVVRDLKRKGGPEKPVFRKRGVCPNGTALTPGTVLVREWQGRPERVMVLEEGFAWNGRSWNALSQVAKAITGTNWNGHRFFGLMHGQREKTA